MTRFNAYMTIWLCSLWMKSDIETPKTKSYKSPTVDRLNPLLLVLVCLPWFLLVVLVPFTSAGSCCAIYDYMIPYDYIDYMHAQFETHHSLHVPFRIIYTFISASHSGCQPRSKTMQGANREGTYKPTSNYRRSPFSIGKPWN